MNFRNDIFTRVAAFAALGAMFECGRLDAAPTNVLPAAPSSQRRHKFQVNDPALAAQLIAQGKKPIADYGGFQIFGAADLDEKTLRDERGELRDDYDVIQLHAGKIDTTTPEAAALKRAVGNFAGKRLHLIQFIGPPKPEWHDALAKTGVRIVTYIPQNCYLVYGDAKNLAALQAHARAAAHVQWESPFLDDYKIHPNARAFDTDVFSIQLLADADENLATLRLIDQLKLAPIRRQYEILDYVNVIVRIPPSRLKDIAARPEVVSIHRYHEPKKHDERQDIIITGNLSGNSPGSPGYLTWLTNKGFSQAQFTASGFVVDVSDSGIDDGSTTPNHFGLFEMGNLNGVSRVIYSRLEGSPHAGSTLAGCDGHGALNAHIIGGYNNQPNGFPHTDSFGYHYGLGVCPFVKLGSSVIFDPDFFTNPNIPNLQSRAYNNGARISNNSWGGGGNGDYDSDSQAYDALVRDAQPAGSAFATAGNQEMVIVFSAGNDGPGAGTVGSPGTAKNVITVGAAENVHSHSTANGGNSTTGSDGCGMPDDEANSANDIADFSSRGPCADGRQKPDLVAPGTHVTGGVPQDSPAPLPTSAGNDFACFDSQGICALSGSGTTGNANNFFPLNQQFYTTSSGTSHSTPAVAGGCALLRQYFLNNSLTPPSPAMTKAYLINSARYMTGVNANDTLWSASQGMGEMNLGFAFDGVPRILRDQLAGDKFTASGQTRSVTSTIFTSTNPLRVTLAWTDFPGSTVGSAYKNNLDLTVTAGGNIYKGNVFSGANSVTGGSADARNNVESVFLPAGIAGNIVVTVTATSINSDGVPNETPSLDQDYALVIYNGTTNRAPQIGAQPQSISRVVGMEAKFSVIAGGEPPLFYQWRFNGADISGATMSAFTITNALFSDAGSYSVVVSNETDVAVSSEATLTITGETNRPKVTITLPAEGFRTSNAVLTVEGTADDNVAVRQVLWQVNNDAVQLAGGRTNWSASVPLAGGTNVFRVYSSDFAGNTSPTNSRKFVHVVLQLFTLITNGVGSVTPSLSGQMLEIGKNYTVTAKPGAGHLFINWQSLAEAGGEGGSGGSSSTNLVLTFTMQTNLVLQANFLANPFIPRSGTYSGLFYQTNVVAHQSSGFFTLTVTSSGAFSCKLLTAGLKPSAKGVFTFEGFASVNVVRKGLMPLMMSLVLDVTNQTGKVLGTVSDGSWVAALEGDRAVFNATTNPAPQNGKYTLAFVHQTSSATIPGGDGVGTVTVDTAGKLALKGTLADGVKASQKTVVSKQGQWPFYLNLYSGQGSTIGWLQFAVHLKTNPAPVLLSLPPPPAQNISGDVSWIKTGVVSGKNYFAGFTNDVVAAGSHYHNPVPARRILNITNGEVVLSANNLDPSLTNGIFLNTNNAVTVTSGSNNLKLTLTASSGAVKGTFNAPAVLAPGAAGPTNQATTKIKGIILPEQNQVRGFFLNFTNSGAVILQGQ